MAAPSRAQGLSPLLAHGGPSPSAEARPTLWNLDRRTIERETRYLYAYSMQRLHDPDLARDAVQETLLAALRSADKFEGRSSLRTWLVAILQHKMTDLLRVRAREAPIYENCPVEERDNGDSDCGGDKSRPTETALQGNNEPEAEFERKEFFSTFEGCLGRIPRRAAEAFVSSVLGEPVAEIARRMGVTQNNCSQILLRARKRLGACFTDCWFENEKLVPALEPVRVLGKTLNGAGRAPVRTPPGPGAGHSGGKE